MTKKDGLNERQNSIKCKTKKDKGLMNGRIVWRQKKIEWNERQNRIMTKKNRSWSEWWNSIMLRQKKMRNQTTKKIE